MASSSFEVRRDEAMDVEDVSPALRQRLGPDGAAGMLALFNVTRQEWAAEVLSAAVDKFETRLGREAAGLRADLRQRDETIQMAFRQLETQLNHAAAAQSAEWRRWMMVIALGQVILSIVGVVALVKFLSL
jgi:hypothetical protein